MKINERPKNNPIAKSQLSVVYMRQNDDGEVLGSSRLSGAEGGKKDG